MCRAFDSPSASDMYYSFSGGLLAIIFAKVCVEVVFWLKLNPAGASSLNALTFITCAFGLAPFLKRTCLMKSISGSMISVSYTLCACGVTTSCGQGLPSLSSKWGRIVSFKVAYRLSSRSWVACRILGWTWRAWWRYHRRGVKPWSFTWLMLSS
jgi:hypothetical protein